MIRTLWCPCYKSACPFSDCAASDDEFMVLLSAHRFHFLGVEHYSSSISASDSQHLMFFAEGGLTALVFGHLDGCEFAVGFLGDVSGLFKDEVSDD